MSSAPAAQVGTTTFGSEPRYRAHDAEGPEQDAQFVSRWIPIWALLLAVVTLVVVVFLITISNSLATINGDLAEADAAVTGVGGEVVTLPAQVETVNNSLTGIDTAVKPIQGNADQIIASLRSIDSKLASVDASLKNTSPTLKTVLGQAGTIRGVLQSADDPPDRLGVQNIHQRVAFLNGVQSRNVGGVAGGTPGPFGVNPGPVSAVNQDARNILADLVEVNKHLLSICASPAVQGPKAC